MKILEKLICIPPGLVSEDGTDIMCWTLRKDFETEILVKENDSKYEVNTKNFNSKHDKLFKLLLSDKQEAIMFIKKVLNFKYELKPEKLELFNKEFITTLFEKMESDIIYKIDDIKTYIIIEHQSTVDRTMPYRMLQYTAELLKNVIDKNKMKKVNYIYPRIISIVLYTGSKPWNIKNIDDLQIPIKGLEKVKPYYKLIDVNNYTKEELLNDNLMITKAMLIEKEKTKNGVIQIISEIEKRINIYYDKRLFELYKIIIQYVLLNIENEKIRKDLIERIKYKRGDEENMLHSTMVLNKAIEKEIKEATRKGLAKGKIEGKAEGKTEGSYESKIKIAKKLLSKKMKLEFISEITELSIEEINELKK